MYSSLWAPQLLIPNILLQLQSRRAGRRISNWLLPEGTYKEAAVGEDAEARVLLYVSVCGVVHANVTVWVRVSCAGLPLRGLRSSKCTFTGSDLVDGRPVYLW